MNKKIQKVNSNLTLSLSHGVLLTKLSRIHNMPKSKVIETLIQKESEQYGLIESREVKNEMV